VPQDYSEAVKWYRKAAEQGHNEVRGRLGRCYAYGYGVAQDKAEAYMWGKLASDSYLDVTYMDELVSALSHEQLRENPNQGQTYK
jgi:hypothetical protein